MPIGLTTSCRRLVSAAAHGDHLGPAIGSDCFGDLPVTWPSTHPWD
ncbi:hypothetical protein I547_2568 [Mycobacterium kansasii 824]|uniref:Uncharacterized protein n=1 Tax=Mycobacterium kansasii TaxID=1768 RepID=A0A1V3WXI7_MYCKA|nr:hypothetical protein I547_2568 [Mycobacterium kansasii 824]KEP44786.1 hypothetical protein MKSMC1_00270 [Mycobacterium kansasii]OOK71478.1 hypothetical protein BZL29_5648 [Mycobacterium kansasii]